MIFRKPLFLIAPFLLFCILFAFAGNSFSDEPANCLICHSAMKGKVKSSSGKLIELNVDTDKFSSSVHGSLDCTVCHIRFSENPHSSPTVKVPQPVIELSSKVSSKYPVDPVAAAACLLCHGEIYDQVIGSVHGQNIIEKDDTDGALCLDCHGSPHYIKPANDPESAVSRQNHIETCAKCHENEGILQKYGLEENVIHSFRESFHGRKLHLGHLSAPVCSSCHNAHDIKSKDDPSSPVFGNNKLKTCGKCHEGANEKFIPAISHKPAGPIPHYSEIGLIILTLGVFIFVISHVLLEAFSDIRDSIFRKKEEE
jgi:hypothetical protein